MESFCAIARIATPIGMISLTADDTVLTAVRIDSAVTAPANIPENHILLRDAAAQLEAWFAGKRKTFDLPLAPADTPCGGALRAGIAAIGYGESLTYGELAQQIGSAARAVGQACRRNPFPIIIPCHRVTSAGKKEFYSGGGGPRTKRWLIDFEINNLPPEQRIRLL